MYQKCYRNLFADPATIPSFQQDVWDKLEVSSGAIPAKRIWLSVVWSKLRTVSNVGPLLDFDLEVLFYSADSTLLSTMRWGYHDTFLASGFGQHLRPAASVNRCVGGAASATDDGIRPMTVTHHPESATIAMAHKDVHAPDSLELFDEFDAPIGFPSTMALNLVIPPFNMGFEFSTVRFRSSQAGEIFHDVGGGGFAYLLAAVAIG